MQPGRKLKPTELKILEGNPGHRPLNENEPKPRKSKIKCPNYIRQDRIAKQEWDRITPELYILNLLTVVDRVSIEILCTQYSIYRWAMADIKENGLTVPNTRRGIKPNPSLAIAREAAKIIKAIVVEFGLTPSSRVRLDVSNPTDEDDPIEKMLSGKI